MNNVRDCHFDLALSLLQSFPFPERTIGISPLPLFSGEIVKPLERPPKRIHPSTND